MIEVVYLAAVLSVTDGDTFRANVDVWPTIQVNTLVRVNGVDAPELKGKCQKEKEMALTAKQTLKTIMSSAKDVVLKNVQQDKYAGRVDADVYVDGQLLARKLIDAKVVRAYDGGRRLSWCD